MIKFKLDPDPVFRAKVSIPVHGGKSAEVEFGFRHRTRDELYEFMKGIEKMEDVAIVMAVAASWELSDPFTEENVRKMLQNYMCSGKAIASRYIDELTAASAGN